MASNPSKLDRWPPYKPGRHVLVLRGRRFDRPWQGLLIEWRRHSYNWYARVSCVQDDGAEVTRWLPATRLYPLDVDPTSLTPTVPCGRPKCVSDGRHRWAPVRGASAPIGPGGV